MRIATLAAPLLLATSAAATEAVSTTTTTTTADPSASATVVGAAGSEYKYGWWIDIQNRQAMALWENSCWKFKEAQNLQIAQQLQRETLWGEEEIAGEPAYSVLSHEITASGDSPKEKVVHCSCVLRSREGGEIDVTLKVANMLGWQPTAALAKAEGGIKSWKWKMPFGLKIMSGRQ